MRLVCGVYGFCMALYGSMAALMVSFRFFLALFSRHYSSTPDRALERCSTNGLLVMENGGVIEQGSSDALV